MNRRTLLRNGRVHNPLVPGATAMLVDGATVGWLGADDDAPVGCDEVIDLGGALVLPAFVDAHVHLTQTGLALDGLDLAATPSLAVAMDELSAYAAARPGAVILGTGWDETRWPEHQALTAEDVDRATNGELVYLARIDGHSAVASTALLQAAAVVSADGVVRLADHHAVRRAAYASITAGQRADAQRRTRDRAAARGIAALHEMGGPDIAGEVDFAQALATSEPGPEVVGYWGELDAIEKARELGAVGAGGDLFVDGSLGSHTAWLSTRYSDADTCGHAWLTADEIAGHVAACVRGGMQTGFHAIGDAANEAVLAGLRQAADRVGLHELAKTRPRIEHAEMTKDVPALARFGVIASVQPAFDAAWGGEGGMYAERLGNERARTLNPFAALASAGVTLAFGSDAPVTPIDPWGSIRAAVRHRTPGHELSHRQAFIAHTSAGYAAARIDGAGALVPGAPASYAVWDVDAADPGTGLPDLDAADPVCLRTVVRGTAVFDTAGAFA